MKLVLNVEALVRYYGNEKAAELAKAAGFDAVDYDICHMETGPDDVFNGDGFVEEAKRIRAIFESAGVPIVQTHTPFRFKNWEDKEHFEGFIMPVMKRSVAVSGLLGAEVAVVHPLHFMRYEGNEEQIFEMNMKYYNELIPIAKEYGVKIAVENMFQVDDLRKHIIHDTCSTIAEFVRYVDTLNSEYITACLDVGHVGLPRGKDEAWDFIRALGHDRLGSLHIHDNDYRNDLHQLPTLGKIDWDKVTQALGEINYSGHFTYEVSSRWICERLARVGDDFALTELSYMASIGKHLISKIEKNVKA